MDGDKGILRYRDITIEELIDFYSGIALRAMGVPKNMFTVLFAIDRLPGWIAQWKESTQDPDWKLNRLRQLYVGLKRRPYKKGKNECNQIKKKTILYPLDYESVGR